MVGWQALYGSLQRDFRTRQKSNTKVQTRARFTQCNARPLVQNLVSWRLGRASLTKREIFVGAQEDGG